MGGISVWCHQQRKYSGLFDHSVAVAEQRWRDLDAELPSCSPQRGQQPSNIRCPLFPPIKAGGQGSDQKPAPGIKQNTSPSMPSFQVRRLQRCYASSPARHKSHVVARSKRARRNVALQFWSQRQVLLTGIFSVLGALSMEARACLSFGTTGTRLWPRSRRSPLSSLSSW
jgi:hypothetical protein